MSKLCSAQAPLAVYTAEELSSFEIERLLDLLIRNEDRVPLALINECARRGEAMVERFATVVEPKAFWNANAASGEWWLRLHVAMILGLISGERAESLLVTLMRRIEQARDENLQDWLSATGRRCFATNRMPLSRRSGIWRKTAPSIGTCVSRRSNSLVVLGARRGAEALDATLDWVASSAAGFFRRERHATVA